MNLIRFYKALTQFYLQGNLGLRGEEAPQKDPARKEEPPKRKQPAAPTKKSAAKKKRQDDDPVIVDEDDQEDGDQETADQPSSKPSSVETEANWEFLEAYWPVEDRPPTLQKKKNVGKLSLEKIRTYLKLYQDAQKLTKSEQDGVVRDQKPKEMKFREAADDGFSKLHQARFCRYPLADPKDWFHKMPTQRKEVFLSMPLDFSGMENCVSDVTIKKMHRRTEFLTLKEFVSENVSVSSRSRKETRTHNTTGSISTTTEFNWFPATNLSQAKEAVFNYSALSFYIWPADPSPIILLKLFNKYDWFPSARDEKTRVDIISAFFNMAMKKVALAAVNLKCVPSYRELEEWLKEILSRNNISAVAPVSSHADQQQQGNNSSNNSFNNRYNRGNNNRNNSNNRPPRLEPEYKKRPICHNFNKVDGTVCSRNQVKDGCKEGNMFYFHRCSQWVKDRKEYCLGSHSRKTCRHR